MNNKAKKYIKFESLKSASNYEHKANQMMQHETTSSQLNSDQMKNESAEKPDNQGKNISNSASERSTITESSEDELLQESNTQENTKKEAKEKAGQVGNPHQSKANRSTMPELADNIPKKLPPQSKSMSTGITAMRSASILGRQRLSTLDPNLIKNLKNIQVDTLNNNDQIEVAVLILQKEEDVRTKTDIDFMVKCTENVNFFKKYDEETHRQCMTKMYHVHLKQGDTCMNFGEYGETFWVTLKGKVGILVPIEKEVVDKQGEVRREKVLTRVAGQGPGYAFGELALLERKPRAATITCESDCDFAVLDKAPFQEILLNKEEKMLFAEVNFLKSIKLFSEWAYNSVRSLFMYSRIRNFVRNQVVYNQFQQAEHMYIIKSGEFKVSFKASYEDNEDVKAMGDSTLKKYLKKKPATRDVELMILTTGEIFGVEELITNQNRVHTVVCYSQGATLIQIEKKEAKNLIFNDPSSKAWLKKYLDSRSEIHRNRISHIRNNTEKVKTYLMRVDMSQSAKMMDFLHKSFENKTDDSDSNNLGDNVLQDIIKNNQVHVNTAEVLRRSPIKTHKKELRKTHSESRIREISPQKWGQQGWAPSNLDCAEETVDPLFTTINNIINIAGKSRNPKPSNLDNSEIIANKESGLRTSLTDQILKRYRRKGGINGDKNSNRILRTPPKTREATSPAFPNTVNNTNIFDAKAGYNDSKEASMPINQFYLAMQSRAAKRPTYLRIAQSMNIVAQESISSSAKNRASNDLAQRRPQQSSFNNSLTEFKQATVSTVTSNKLRDSIKTDQSKDLILLQGLSIGRQTDSDLSLEHPVQLSWMHSGDGERRLATLTPHAMFFGKKLRIRSESSGAQKRTPEKLSPSFLKVRDKLVLLRSSINVKTSPGKRESSFELKQTLQPVRVQRFPSVTQDQNLLNASTAPEKIQNSSPVQDSGYLIANTRKTSADLDENLTNFVVKTAPKQSMDLTNIADFNPSQTQQVPFDEFRIDGQKSAKPISGMKKLNLKNLQNNMPIKVLPNNQIE